MNNYPMDVTTSLQFMRERQLNLIKDTIRILGPERCESALNAFDDPKPDGYRGCALARAYGQKDELMKHLFPHLVDDINPKFQIGYEDWYNSRPEILRVFGITESMEEAFTKAFDEVGFANYVTKAELKTLIEAEALKARTPKLELVYASHR
jgi:hypothetical protein